VSVTIAEADRQCRRLLRGHYENFWVASPFVGHRQRIHLARIYAYSRTTDDLGDESRGDALCRLVWWRAELEESLRTGRSSHPVLAAISRSVEELELPVRPFYDLIDANIQDQRVKLYRTWSELRAYCMLSAAPVGRLVLRVFEAPAGLEPFSDEVCIGLQLANFAQDVAVDARKGRCYLIEEEVEAAGLLGAIELLCERAAWLLASGIQVEAAVTGALRLQLALYRLGGEAILAGIRRARYRTDEQRPTVSRAGKLALLPVAAWQSLGLRNHVG
jgi:squalene synthase HpnC